MGTIMNKEFDKAFNEFLTLHEEFIQQSKLSLEDKEIEKTEVEIEEESIEFENKYVMLKIDDIEKYLSIEQKYNLKVILLTIRNGRHKDNKPKSNDYILCNQDEAYAKEVWEIIKHGETIKHTNIKQT